MLQAQAIDTLGILARNIGRENFLPLAPECIEMGKVKILLFIFLKLLPCLLLIEHHAV